MTRYGTTETFKGGVSVQQEIDTRETPSIIVFITHVAITFCAQENVNSYRHTDGSARLTYKHKSDEQVWNCIITNYFLALINFYLRKEYKLLNEYNSWLFQPFGVLHVFNTNSHTPYPVFSQCIYVYKHYGRDRKYDVYENKVHCNGNAP